MTPRQRSNPRPLAPSPHAQLDGENDKHTMSTPSKAPQFLQTPGGSATFGGQYSNMMVPGPDTQHMPQTGARSRSASVGLPMPTPRSAVTINPLQMGLPMPEASPMTQRLVLQSLQLLHWPGKQDCTPLDLPYDDVDQFEDAWFCKQISICYAGILAPAAEADKYDFNEADKKRYNSSTTTAIGYITKAYRDPGSVAMAKASCTELMYKAYMIHIIGMPKTDSADRTSTFKQRVQEIIDVVKANKRIAWDVVRGQGLDSIAQNPAGYLHKKIESVRSNSTRDHTLHSGGQGEKPGRRKRPATGESDQSESKKTKKSKTGGPKTTSGLAGRQQQGPGMASQAQINSSSSLSEWEVAPRDNSASDFGTPATSQHECGALFLDPAGFSVGYSTAQSAASDSPSVGPASFHRSGGAAASSNAAPSYFPLDQPGYWNIPQGSASGIGGFPASFGYDEGSARLPNGFSGNVAYPPSNSFPDGATGDVASTSADQYGMPQLDQPQHAGSASNFSSQYGSFSSSGVGYGSQMNLLDHWSYDESAAMTNSPHLTAGSSHGARAASFAQILPASASQQNTYPSNNGTSVAFQAPSPGFLIDPALLHEEQQPLEFRGMQQLPSDAVTNHGENISNADSAVDNFIPQDHPQHGNPAGYEGVQDDDFDFNAPLEANFSSDSAFAEAMPGQSIQELQERAGLNGFPFH